jgi:outer membrane protein
MAPAVKDKETKALQALEQELQTKNTQFQQQYDQRKQEVLAPITDMVKKVLDDLREEGNYSMILMNDPGQTPIVSADKNLDITDKAISRLRATKAPAIPAAKGGAPSAPAGVTRPGGKPPAK